MRKKRKVILFGTGRFAVLLSRYIEAQEDWEICAYALEQQCIQEPTFQNRPVTAWETIARDFPPEEYDVVLGIGYHGMNTLREKIFFQAREMGYALPNFISSQSCIGSDCKMGAGNVILEGAIISIFSCLGNANVIWNGCNISHAAQIGDFNYFAPSAVLGGCVTVTNHCFLGLNCTIKGATTLAPFTLVGAGCYLSCSSQPNGVYVPPRSYRLENKASLDMGL